NKVTGVAFLPDGSVVSTDWDGVTIAWDVEHRTPKWKAQSEGYNQCFAVSPDGRWVVTERAVYSTKDGTKVAQVAMYSWSMTFSPDGRRLIYPSDYGHIAIRDVETWTIVNEHAGDKSSFVAISSSPDGKF